ncbi:MAG: tRNA (guanosine(37)-N1)-methyltransferase TrmD [Oscillospiraceae bacterium]|nr:tRNA (guanosine(37)-N1)-methyltransferase TrmD [Oscillospiraceae bacterium]
MRIDIATLFPDMCDSVLHTSVLGRGIKNGFIEIFTHDIRLYTKDKHRNVDDKPYGGGTGLVMQAQPIYDCVMTILEQHKTRPRIIYLSPRGETLTQNKVRELAAEDGLILICGHYEGVDERVLEELNAEEISVGDYVLTGGELPALIIADAVARLQPGVLPNEDAYSLESHYNGLLEQPQYTRPEVWRGRTVPEILLSGDHKKVTEWQLEASIEITRIKRPDLYEKYLLDHAEEIAEKQRKEREKQRRKERRLQKRAAENRSGNNNDLLKG